MGLELGLRTSIDWLPYRWAESFEGFGWKIRRSWRKKGWMGNRQAENKAQSPGAFQWLPLKGCKVPVTQTWGKVCRLQCESPS